MKRVTPVLLVLALAACAAPAAAPSATASVAAAGPTPTPPPTAAPTTAAPTATTAPAASASLIPLPNVAQLSAPSGNLVWALVANSRLFRSTDRGDTWQERPAPAQSADKLVSFIDDHEGWLATLGPVGTECQSQSVVALSHTVDAGGTWSSLNVTGIPPTQCKSTMTFTSSSNGFITAYDPNSPPIVYRTANGGQSWTASQPFADPPGFVKRAGSGGLVPMGIRSFGAALLADVAGPTAHYAYRSSDGGATWTYLNTAANQLDVIAFVTATRWLQVSSPGNSKETTDGGATWHAFTSDYQQAAPVSPAITFGDAQAGYATVRGSIQRTIDGGAHWTSLRTPGTF